MGAKGEREMGNRGREIYLPALEGGGPQIFCDDGPWRALEMSARGSRMSAGADGAQERERAGAGRARERERAGRRRELAWKRKGSGGGVRDPWTRCGPPHRESSGVLRHRGERRLGVLFRRRFLHSLPPSSINLLPRHQNAYVAVQLIDLDSTVESALGLPYQF